MTSRPARTVEATVQLIPLLFPVITLIGVGGIVLPAFGWLPALGFHSLSLSPWRELLATPALLHMVMTTLFVGITATLLSLLLALTFAVTSWERRLWKVTERTLAPLLSIPHSALAIGVIFLLAPSGFFSRLTAGPMGWSRPPDLLTVNDPYGFSLIVTLILKEAPFLSLMLMAAASQTPVARLLTAGRALGYSPIQCWLKLIWPQIYPKMRLSVLIVLAFSLSVVDVALIVGPNLPPLLPVQILQWQQDPDLARQLPAAAAALLLLLMVGGSMLLWLGSEKLLGRALQNWLIAGYRGSQRKLFMRAGRGLWAGTLLLAAASLIIVIVWSFSWRWRFPDIWPSVWSLRTWEQYFPRLLEPMGTTLGLALASALLGLVMSVLCLEFQRHHNRWQQKISVAFFYLPLLLPQMAFLLGIQTSLVALHLDGYWWTVVCCHLLFVFPYCYLSLAGSWREYDQRFSQAGRLLSGSFLKTFLYIKLPMLMTPLLSTLALGIAVSTALYLPTILAGAGRFETLTTEAVALASGGNRRLLALYALMQQLIPMVFFAMALLIPQILSLRLARTRTRRTCHGS